MCSENEIKNRFYSAEIKRKIDWTTPSSAAATLSDQDNTLLTASPSLKRSRSSLPQHLNSSPNLRVATQRRMSAISELSPCPQSSSTTGSTITIEVPQTEQELFAAINANRKYITSENDFTAYAIAEIYLFEWRKYSPDRQ